MVAAGFARRQIVYRRSFQEEGSGLSYRGTELVLHLKYKVGCIRHDIRYAGIDFSDGMKAILRASMKTLTAFVFSFLKS